MPIDYSEYHPKWSLISRLIRFHRAGNRCEGSPRHPNCRAINGEPHPSTGSVVVLTTAHLDHNIQNNKFSNLKAWCQRCHLVYDANHHANSRRYGRDWKKDQTQLKI